MTKLLMILVHMLPTTLDLKNVMFLCNRHRERDNYFLKLPFFSHLLKWIIIKVYCKYKTFISFFLKNNCKNCFVFSFFSKERERGALQLLEWHKATLFFFLSPFNFGLSKFIITVIFMIFCNGKTLISFRKKKKCL